MVAMMNRDFHRKSIEELLKKGGLRGLLEKIGGLHRYFYSHAVYGVKAGYIAMCEIGMTNTGMKEVVSIVETNNCFNDSIQVVAGCSFVYSDYGKTAVTVAKRDGTAIRIALNPDFEESRAENYPEANALFEKLVVRCEEPTPEERVGLMQLFSEMAIELLDCNDSELFTIEHKTLTLPEYAPMFASVRCSICGENVMDTRVRAAEGKPVGILCAGNEHYAMKAAIGSDAFTVTMIANAWGYGAPYDFLKCVEFHNHFCTGVTLGYMLADYLLEEYPRGDDEKYVVIACSTWCKDDALQVMLDTTVEKRSIFTKNMPEHDEIENAAGTYIVWNGTLASGIGYVLSFDFDYARNVSDVAKSYFEIYPVASRIRMDWGMMPYLNQPKIFIATIYTFNVTYDLLKRLELAGVDLYVELGLAEPTEVRGDFNGGGKVTSADALLLLQVAAGKITH
jgi:formylmethanofuran dehydrogenase subunit E